MQDFHTLDALPVIQVQPTASSTEGY